jgi:hypothetical protein
MYIQANARSVDLLQTIVLCDIALAYMTAIDDGMHS